VDASEMISKLP